MIAIKAARKYIESHPESERAGILARLVLSLETETEFEVTDLYKLDRERFDLAIEILQEWRIDRFYAGKAKLFDLSWQVNEMVRAPVPQEAPAGSAGDR